MEVTGQGTSVFLPSSPGYFGGAVNSLKESSMTHILKTFRLDGHGEKGVDHPFFEKQLLCTACCLVFLFVSPYRSTHYNLQCMDEVNYYSNVLSASATSI